MYYVVIFAVFFLALKMCSSGDSSSQVRVPTDTDYIYFAQAGLKKRLKDPDSAQFKNTYLSRKSGTPVGFDHGAGHPLLFLDDAKAPRGQKIKKFNGLGDDPFNASVSLF